jgi:YYY domain-containing protein
MIDLLRWYLVLQLIGLAALPLAARAFRCLPDRGYALARPVGMLAVAAALWFGAIFGLWPNTGAMVALLVLALALVGWLGLRPSVAELRRLWQRERDHLFLIEWLFLAALVFWAVCRSFFPDIASTEKPMEFAFLNGILRSQRFPPVDPWLSGHSISYYYLGYVMVAAVTELSGVTPAVAFNLALATLFALTITGAFAMGHALVEGLRRTQRAADAGPVPDDASEPGLLRPYWPAWLGGGLAAFFVALIGNWEGFLELLHAHGIGSAAFWQRLAIWHLGAPYVSPVWYPTDAQDNWWWFRATRVILDYPAGSPPPDNYNTITEFPFFSFLLGDVHPHVLALPFAFVCLAYGLSFLRSTAEFRLDRLGEHLFDLGFIAFLFGAMFLLNAWDILTYLFVLVCAFAVHQYLWRPRFDTTWLKRVVIFGVLTLAISGLLYWPFYLTFQSQASGLLGIVHLHSHLSYFVWFWGPFLFLAGSLVIAELVFGLSPLPRPSAGLVGPRWTRSPLTWLAVLVVAVIAVVGQAPALALIVPLLVGALALAVRYLAGTARSSPAAAAEAPAGTPALAAAGPEPRSDGSPTPIAGGAVPAAWALEHVYVFVLLFVAALLIFGTELVFIQDSFGNRMNTVFKLYYQAWQLLALVGAYTVYYLGRGAWRSVRAGAGRVGRTALPRVAAIPWLAVTGVLVAAAFVYVPAALAARSNGFTNPMTLDGLRYYALYEPDDAAGIAWLDQHVTGTPVILEATGGSYSAFDNVAWMTGLPTVLGWDFHEIQWHGSAIIPVVDQRKRDIQTIYTTTNLTEAQTLLTEYHVTYVYVGPLERQAFGANNPGLDKFGAFMNVVYQNPGVTIYQVRGAS